MTRGVQWSLVCFVVFLALLAVAGCSHYLFAEREPWRHDAEIACLNSGAVKDTPQRVRISSIGGPGICGMDYPIRVAALGDNPPLAYDTEPPRPPSAIPSGPVQDLARDLPPAVSQGWPDATSRRTRPSPVQSSPAQSSPVQSNSVQPSSVQPSTIQSRALPPVQSTGPQYDPYAGAGYAAPSRRAMIAPGQANQPLSLYPPGLPPPDEDDEEIGIPGGAPHPYYGSPQAPYAPGAERNSVAVAPPQQPPPTLPSLGPPRGPLVTGSAGPVEVSPPATLACPIVAALDQWIATSVQPAALRWFRQPVVEIKQISAYSCRGMNGNPNAHISEHAFGNALDIAEFDLADGHVVSVQHGWRGTPEEQGFLHDVQSAACDQFSTVLAPGANVYHYNHIHVDLMRHVGGRHICEPAAIPGDVVAERARARYATRHYGDPDVTGSVPSRPQRRSLGYSGEEGDRRPPAIPGED